MSGKKTAIVYKKRIQNHLIELKEYMPNKAIQLVC